MRSAVFVIVILSLRPSVRLSVWHTRELCPHCLTYDHSSLYRRCIILVSADIRTSHNSKGVTLSEGVEWGWVGTNKRFSTFKPPYHRNGARYDKDYYWSLMRNRIHAFDWYQNQWPWLTLKWPWTAIMHSAALHTCISQPLKFKWRYTNTIRSKNVAQGS